jgi:hypothetical protein
VNDIDLQMQECKKLQRVRDKITRQIIDMKNKDNDILQEIYDKYMPIVIKLTESATDELNKIMLYIDSGGWDDDHFKGSNKKLMKYYSASIETLVIMMVDYQQRKQKEEEND